MTYMWNEIVEQPDVMLRCIDKNMDRIKALAQMAREKEISSVLIAARGTSDHAAVYGKYIMEILLGIPVTLAAPSVFTMYNKDLLLKNTLVIGISQSGKAADVLEVLKSANSTGTPTIAITNFPDSPLALEANIHLDCSAGIEKSVAATKTFIAQITLLALMASEWSQNKSFKQQLLEIPRSLKEFIENSSNINEKVQRYRYMNECFVLARGINYAIALESALKIQETCYVRAKAYATSDFHHGPFAMIEAGMPVIVFAPAGPSLTDVKEMIQKLQNSQAELIIISDIDELREMGVCSMSIPGINNDMISPFYNVTVAQMFACQLALAKGLNPDSPRGLNKVTITK